MFRLATVEDWWETSIKDEYSYLNNPLNYSVLKRVGYSYLFSIIEKIKPQRILEFGCGTGSPLFSQFQNDVTIWGVDKCPDYINYEDWIKFREKFSTNKSFKFITGFVGEKELNLPSNSFDICASVSTIEHIPIDSLESVFKEVYRILKKGGLFFSSFDLFYNVHTGWLESVFNAIEKSGLTWYDKNANIKLDWVLSSVTIEDTFNIMNYYLAYMPVEERIEFFQKHTGNWGTVLILAVK